MGSFAELTTKQCNPIADLCHNTDQYLYCGQNIAIQCITGTINVDNALTSLVNTWISKSNLAAVSDMESFDDKYDIKKR